MQLIESDSEGNLKLLMAQARQPESKQGCHGCLARSEIPETGFPRRATVGSGPSKLIGRLRRLLPVVCCLLPTSPRKCP